MREQGEAHGRGTQRPSVPAHGGLTGTGEPPTMGFNLVVAAGEPRDVALGLGWGCPGPEGSTQCAAGVARCRALGPDRRRCQRCPRASGVPVPAAALRSPRDPGSGAVPGLTVLGWCWHCWDPSGREQNWAGSIPGSLGCALVAKRKAGGRPGCTLIPRRHRATRCHPVVSPTGRGWGPHARSPQLTKTGGFIRNWKGRTLKTNTPGHWLRRGRG